MALHYMTQDGLDKLKKELSDAIAQRPVISAQIAEARDKGDLSENAEYEAAREAQGLLELKISKSRIEEGFAIPDDMDEAGITTYLSKVKKNEVAKGLEDRSSAFSLSTTEDQGKELAKDWAKNLPDA